MRPDALAGEDNISISEQRVGLLPSMNGRGIFYMRLWIRLAAYHILLSLCVSCGVFLFAWLVWVVIAIHVCGGLWDAAPIAGRAETWAAFCRGDSRRFQRGETRFNSISPNLQANAGRIIWLNGIFRPPWAFCWGCICMTELFIFHFLILSRRGTLLSLEYSRFSEIWVG